MEDIDLIRSGDDRRGVIRKRPLEMRVDDISVSLPAGILAKAGRLDEDYASRADLTRDPCRDAVARHAPGMRKRIRIAQPAERREHRDMTSGERRGNRAWRFDDLPVREPLRDEMRVLVHREHGHPVRRIIGEMNPAIDVTHRVGERTAAWDDEDPALARSRTDRRHDRVEVRRVREQRTADLDDNLYIVMRHRCG